MNNVASWKMSRNTFQVHHDLDMKHYQIIQHQSTCTTGTTTRSCTRSSYQCRLVIQRTRKCHTRSSGEIVVKSVRVHCGKLILVGGKFCLYFWLDVSTHRFKVYLGLREHEQCSVSWPCVDLTIKRQTFAVVNLPYRNMHYSSY